MGDFTQNKQPKDVRLIQLIRKVIVNDMRLNRFSMNEIANQLGLQAGTLENKLKPSSINEFTLSEIEHIIELTGDKTILTYLSNKHGGAFVEVNNCKENSNKKIHQITDNTQILNNEVFRSIKMTLQDEKLTDEEINNNIELIHKSINTLMELKTSLGKRAKIEVNISC
ncbi:MAG: phage regulatory CII family protein [Sulfurovaceae bacterium]